MCEINFNKTFYLAQCLISTYNQYKSNEIFYILFYAELFKIRWVFYTYTGQWTTHCEQHWFRAMVSIPHPQSHVPRTFSKVCDIFACHNWGLGILLASNGDKLGVLLNILQCTGQSTQELTGPNSSAKVEGPWYRGKLRKSSSICNKLWIM